MHINRFFNKLLRYHRTDSQTFQLMMIIRDINNMLFILTYILLKSIMQLMLSTYPQNPPVNACYIIERITLVWPGYAQVTVRICPIYLESSSSKAYQLRIDFKSVRYYLQGKNTFLYITNLFDHSYVIKSTNYPLWHI